MPDLAIIVPTRGRPENIRKVIAAWDFTNAWDVADLILAVDADDPEIGGYRFLQQELDHPDTGEALVTLVEIQTWMPMVHKLDLVASAVAIGNRNYFALGFAGDDHLPRTINWAKRYLTALRELGTGMVYGDDGYQGAKLSTEWAVTADAVRALGRMVPAPVEHMYCDNAMMDLFGGAGALRHLPEIRIEHMHPVVGKAETDDQYKRVNHRDQFGKDRKSYERWVRLELPSQIAVIRSMRPGAPVESPIKPRSAPVATRPNRSSRIAARSGPSQNRTNMARFPFSSHLKYVRGATPDEIGMALADFAKQVPADQEIVELGVFQGRTAMIMAWGARQGNGAHVTAIDPWDLPGNVYDPPFTDAENKTWAEYRIRELGYQNWITLIQDYSHRVAERYDRELSGTPVGLLYVDGDHTKNGARRDIEAWAPHLAPGAVIAVDDYGHPDWPGVGEAVDELVAEGFLAPIELYHDRLAVTRLNIESDQFAPDGKAHPPIYPVTRQDNGTVMVENEPPAEKLTKLAPGIYSITSEGVAPPPEAAPVDSSMSNEVVHEDELIDVDEGTPIGELNLVNLKALAKVRRIVLGARKDKRDLILQALRDGE